MGSAAPVMPHWPACMNRDLALAYTGVAEAQLREWERRGLVRFRPRGPHGAVIAPKVDLDAAVSALFDGTDSEIEFD